MHLLYANFFQFINYFLAVLSKFLISSICNIHIFYTHKIRKMENTLKVKELSMVINGTGTFMCWCDIFQNGKTL